MDALTLLLTAVGLSMDAFAVSISNTMCYMDVRKRHIFVSSAAFGVFQGVMPLIGFFVGRLFSGLITAVDHWVALVLLGFIGGKMLVEGVRTLRHPQAAREPKPYSVRVMLVQALATSIDALAVGISFAALAVNIWLSAAVIAAVTFACCVAGGFWGRRFSQVLGDWAQIAGGAILVGIGLKIFIEHMLGG